MASLGSRLGLRLGYVNKQFQSPVILHQTRTLSILPNSRRAEREDAENQALARQISRKYAHGDVYAPHDLSPAEARKWKKRHQPTTDAFDVLNVNPVTLYKVSLAILSNY
jgi:small subunit ribosomal protein S18